MDLCGEAQRKMKECHIMDWSHFLSLGGGGVVDGALSAFLKAVKLIHTVS